MNIRELTQQIEIATEQESERIFKVILNNVLTIEDLYTKIGSGEVEELMSKEFIESEVSTGEVVLPDVIQRKVRRKVTDFVMGIRIGPNPTSQEETD